jgi:hypothetical protein
VGGQSDDGHLRHETTGSATTDLSVATKLTSNAAHTGLFWFLPDNQLIVTGNRGGRAVSVTLGVVEDEVISERRGVGWGVGSVSKEEVKADGRPACWENEITISNPNPGTRNPARCHGRRASKLGGPDRDAFVSAQTGGPRRFSQGESRVGGKGRTNGNSRTVDLGWGPVKRVARTAERRRPSPARIGCRWGDRGTKAWNSEGDSRREIG